LAVSSILARAATALFAVALRDSACIGRAYEKAVLRRRFRAGERPFPLPSTGTLLALPGDGDGPALPKPVIQTASWMTQLAS
jgi:hypothetical protein